MPVVERSGRTSEPNILLWGCGGCALFVVILCVAGYFGFRCFFGRIFSQIMSPTPPPKSSTPYVFPYHKQATRCSLVLPAKNGTLTYSHLLSNTYVSWGERAIEVKDSAGRSQEWPLPSGQFANVKVGVYWYPAKNGLGPFIRFYDSTGNSVLDLGTKDIGQLLNINGKNHFASYAYDAERFDAGYSIKSTKKGKVTAANDVYGNPARDVSSVVTPNNCIYLGSIVRKGNSLVFQQNPKGGSRKP